MQSLISLPLGLRWCRVYHHTEQRAPISQRKKRLTYAWPRRQKTIPSHGYHFDIRTRPHYCVFRTRTKTTWTCQRIRFFLFYFWASDQRTYQREIREMDAIEAKQRWRGQLNRLHNGRAQRSCKIENNNNNNQAAIEDAIYLADFRSAWCECRLLALYRLLLCARLHGSNIQYPNFHAPMPGIHDTRVCLPNVQTMFMCERQYAENINFEPKVKSPLAAICVRKIHGAAVFELHLASIHSTRFADVTFDTFVNM